MNGKQLKDWAAKVHDDAVIECKERYNHDWIVLEIGTVRATLVMQSADLGSEKLREVPRVSASQENA